MLQDNEVMDIRSKPTFVPRRHHLLFSFLLCCLFSCLFALSLVCLPSCLLAISFAHLLAFMLYLPYLSCLFALCHFAIIYAFLFHCLSPGFLSFLLVSCLFLCMYAHGARTHGARAWSSKCKQKGAITSMGQVATVNRFSV